MGGIGLAVPREGLVYLGSVVGGQEMEEVPGRIEAL